MKSATKSSGGYSLHLKRSGDHREQVGEKIARGGEETGAQRREDECDDYRRK